MELSSLARIQKRIADWSIFIAHGVPDAELKGRFQELLTELKKVVVQCWEQGSVAPTAESKIRDLERRLEAASEEARVTVGGFTPLKKEEGLAVRGKATAHHA